MKKLSKLQLAVLARTREFVRGLADFKFAVSVSLFVLEGCIAFACIGVTMIFAERYNLLFAYLSGLGLYCLFNAPVIYWTWRRIQHEDSMSRVLSETWEGKKDTALLVAEYTNLLEQKKKKPLNL